MPDADKPEELQVLITEFTDGFVAATDRMSYLRLAATAYDVEVKRGKRAEQFSGWTASAIAFVFARPF